VLSGKIAAFHMLLCAAMFLGSSVLLPAQTSSNAASGGTTSLSPVTTPFSRFLSPYEPVYFLLGTYPAAEFQFSLKYQPFYFTNGSARPLTNFYLAYTQTSFWDLLSSDPSFYDTSYKPSGFLLFPDVLSHPNGGSFQLDLQSGLEHESNGRGGTGERSLYTAYLEPTFSLGRPGSLQISLAPRAWFYAINVGRNNPDIADYRGYADLRGDLRWRRKDQGDNQAWQLETTFRTGDQGSHSSLKFDLSFSVREFVSWFTPRIHVQYFEGYGQTLRQYNQSSHGLRAGISLYD
jgi:outer membrane phospholipase A